MDGGGNFRDISTQAVLDLFKNVNEANENEATIIDLEMADVDKFHIAREEIEGKETTRAPGI